MKTIPSSVPPVHIGIDVAKDSLQVDLVGKSTRFSNTAEGHRLLAAALPPAAFVIMEATGSYHLALLRFLHRSGIPVAVVNPARARFFAKSRGTLAKTDPVDAAMLSAFGKASEPPASSPQEPGLESLGELSSVRSAFLSEITLWRNLLEHQQSAEARSHSKARLKQAIASLAKVDRQIAAMMEQSPGIAPVATVLRECKGVGIVTATVLIAEMPELGKINRREAASLAGLAPFASDSGKSHSKRMTRAGRPRVKKALYLASLSAVRFHPALKDAYKELRAKGKPAKVALIAIARRLVVILNAKLKEHYSNTVIPLETGTA